MPAAFLAAGLATAVAPLQWWPAAVTLVGLQLLASLAVLRLLWLLLGPRPALLAPLALYLFAPLTVPSFAWWAAGLNSLPMQAALAWVAGDALLLARTGRCWYALTGTVVTAVALAFFEKSVLVPLVAFVVLALVRGWTASPRRVGPRGVAGVHCGSVPERSLRPGLRCTSLSRTPGCGGPAPGMPSRITAPRWDCCRP